MRRRRLRKIAAFNRKPKSPLFPPGGGAKRRVILHSFGDSEIGKSGDRWDYRFTRQAISSSCFLASRSAFQLGRDLRQVAAPESRAGVRQSEQAFGFSPTGARFYIMAESPIRSGPVLDNRKMARIVRTARRTEAAAASSKRFI